jgi:hypothetical protein
MRKIKSQIKTTKTTRTARITFALNADLCQQAENMLEAQWTQFNYTYRSLSELIRKSLEAYQEREIEINPTERDKHAPKREVSIRFFNTDLLNFYYSLPYSQRVGIVEESLRQYLNKISLGSKGLEKYKKIVQPKPKKTQKELTPYRLECFSCDNCGDEYYDGIAYSYAPSLKEINDYQTYCSNCVVSE